MTFDLATVSVKTIRKKKEKIDKLNFIKIKNLCIKFHY